VTPHDCRGGWLAAFTAAALALWIAPVIAPAQTGRSDRPRTASDVRDHAKLFDPDAVMMAKHELELIERKFGVQTVVETVESLRGEQAAAVATRNVQVNGVRGIYILIAKDEAKFEMVVTPGFTDALPRARQGFIRDAFLDRLRIKEIDRALLSGVHTIYDELNAAREEERNPRGGAARSTEHNPSSQSSSGSLVVRNQVRLTLTGARRIIAGAEAKAAEMGQKMNIAVVDDGGHLLSFARMDGARPASGYTAITKATTAATFRQESGPVPKGTTQPDPLLNLSLQNAAAASGGKITTLYGGVPVVVDGQVIGGVGVGGGSGEQDAQVARAGIDAFLSELKATPTRDAQDRNTTEEGRKTDLSR
jgi:glc operon protein GlcG